MVIDKDKKNMQQNLFYQDEALQGKLSTKEKAASDLETKNKSMKTDITAKNKQIKELEKEVCFIVAKKVRLFTIKCMFKISSMVFYYINIKHQKAYKVNMEVQCLCQLMFKTVKQFILVLISN